MKVPRTAKVLWVVVAMAALSAPLLPAGLAGAAPTVISRSGSTGRVTLGQTRCVTYLYDDGLGFLAHPMVVNQFPPIVRGVPSVAATQWVRFRSRLKDLTTGQVSYSAWAPWQVASPTVPARWTGSVRWGSLEGQIDVTHRYAGQTQILWWWGGRQRGSVNLQHQLNHNMAFWGVQLVADGWRPTCANYNVGTGDF